MRSWSERVNSAQKALLDLKGRGTSKQNDTVFFNFEITESNNWDIVISLINLSRYRRFREICTIRCSFRS